MGKNQCTRERTVKNIKQYLGVFRMQERYAIHRFLSWFEIDRKVERIVWAILEKAQRERMKIAEEIAIENKRIKKAKEEGLPYRPNPDRIVEPGEIKTIIGLCPKCSSTMVGTPVPGCRKKTVNRVFYKECTACTYYAEVFKRHNKVYEVEGG